MRKLSITLTLCLIVKIFTPGYAQSQKNTTYPDSSYRFLETTFYGSTEKRLPFWMHTNQFGIVPVEGPVGSLHTGLEQYWNLSKSTKKVKAWRVGGGAEVAANLAPGSKILLPQVFGTIRFKNWEIFAGRKKQWVGLADSTLGIGSYIWSGNALPIPKIQFGTSKFISVPFTNNLIAFNAFYSDGYFDKNRPVTSNLKLHQKAFYLRIGNVTSKLRLYGGFNHQVQWGGNTPYQTLNGQMPKGFKSYLNAVTGKRGPKQIGLSSFDSENRIGNHLGTVDFAMEIDFRTSSLFVYRQNIYEDGSLYRFNNIRDGLNGIRLRRKTKSGSIIQITDIVLEYLYTESQGGSTVTNKAARGRDDYFNNGQVHDGWSYHDRGIGTPFILPTSATKKNWPVYSDFFTSNNRVAVYNIGLKGKFLQQVIWLGKLSYTKNYGTYALPFKNAPNEIYGIFSLQIPVSLFGGTMIKSSFAVDAGELLNRNYGFSLGLQKVLY